MYAQTYEICTIKKQKTDEQKKYRLLLSRIYLFGLGHHVSLHPDGSGQFPGLFLLGYSKCMRWFASFGGAYLYSKQIYLELG